MNTRSLLPIVAASAALLSACSDSDSGQRASICPAVGDLTVNALSQSNGQNRCEITGTLTENATLSNDISWFLEGGVQIGNALQSPTLTIEGGTTIYGDNVGASQPDHLLVYPGAGLQANGTGANPVHFLSDDDDTNGTGEWGGVFIRGAGDHLLDYVVVAEAGAQTQVTVGGNPATYSDNIVLRDNDENTRLTFVQSHDSARDGIRIQNGTPRLSWILVTGAQRDGIWYQDFNGLIKDLMVIHRTGEFDGTTGGRSGIYASETVSGDSNPRIVNATLVGRDGRNDRISDPSTSTSDNEFGILFADNTNAIRLANVLIANFANGCYEADSSANLSTITTANYVDGVHCANEAGGNPDFGVVRTSATDFGSGITGTGNGDGLRYYNGSNSPINFTGETATRNFTAGWYLNSIGSIGNGLVGNPSFLNGFRDGDTNADSTVDGNDIGATPFLGVAGPNNFNNDVAADTGGYDLTHIGAVRSGSDASAAQFNNWTVSTQAGEGFAVPLRLPI